MNKFMYFLGLIAGAVVISRLGMYFGLNTLQVLIIAGLWGFLYRPIVAFFKGLLQ
jgi:hypothetical protein